MGKKRITEIEVERHETLVIWRPRHEPRPLCPECGEVETMVKPEEASAIAGVSLRVVFRWVEAALVHFIETPDGRVYVCANSLPLSAGKSITRDADG
jgi:hypothetical protein